MKNTTLMLALAFISLSTTALAQPNIIWEKTMDGNGTPGNLDEAKYTFPTADGNSLIVIGNGYNGSDFDILAYKLDITNGSIEVSQSYDLGIAEQCYNSMIAFEHANGFIIAGDLEAGVDDNYVFTAKASDLTEETAVLSYTLPGAGASCLIEHYSSNQVLVGSPFTANTSIQNARIQVIKLDIGVVIDTIENEDPIWGETLKLIKKTPGGGYLVFGEGKDPSTLCGSMGRSIWVCKMNASLAVEWSKFYGGNAKDDFKDAVVTANNGCYILGGTLDSCFNSVTGPSDIGTGDWIIELDATGNVVQTPVIVGYDSISHSKSVNALSLNATGSLFMAGATINAMGTHAFFERIDYQNDQVSTVWNRNFNTDPNKQEIATGLSQNAAGQTFCHGTTVNGGDGDFWVAMLETPFDCSVATSIECGQTLANQSTINGSNDIKATHLANCVVGNSSYAAPDNLYEIVVEQEQQLNFLLEIVTANADLDLFLLDECDAGVHCIASTVEDNTASKIESIDAVLQPGTYYLVADGKEVSNVANYKISVFCDSTHAEPANDLPDGTIYLSEGFEKYEAGKAVAPQSTRWSEGVNGGPSAIVKSINNNEYLEITNQGGNNPDLMYDLDHQSNGRYRLSWRMFLENNLGGQYNVMHNLPDEMGNGGVDAYRVYFGPDGQGWVQEGNSSDTLATFVYLSNIWSNVVNLINIDENKAELWINKIFVASWDFNNGLDQLGGLQFFATGGNLYRLDDIALWQPAVICQYDTINTADLPTVCTQSGKQFDSEYHARCDGLYTSSEWDGCSGICEKGGQSMYRGDVFLGDFERGDRTPSLLFQEACVIDAYGGIFPNEPLYSDSYIFYNDSFNQDTINIEFGQNSPFVKGFVFSCDCETVPNVGVVCTQTCLGTTSSFNGIDSPPGFYYIVTMGPVGESYDLAVLPASPCAANLETLDINAGPVLGSVIGETNNFDTTNFEFGDYASVYDGNRSYEGDDIEYRFMLEQPTVVNITLTAANPDTKMGLFLYSYLCGRDCMAYAEIPPSSDSIKLTSLRLNAGVYYLAVDTDSSSNRPASDLGKGLNTGEFMLNLSGYPDTNFIDEFFPNNFASNENCSLIPNSTHLFQVNNDAYEFTTNTNIIFLTKDMTGDQDLVVTYKTWNAPANWTTFQIGEDDSSNPQKCSYFSGDPISIILHDSKTSSILATDIVFGTNDPKVFSPGTTSAVTELKLVNETYIDLDPEYYNPSASGFENKPVKLGSSVPWEIIIPPSIDWLQVNQSTGQANSTVYLKVFPNPTQLKREADLEVHFISEETTYARTMKVVQSSKCLKPEVSISFDPTLCEGDSVTLNTLVTGSFEGGPPVPANKAAYDFYWNTGETTDFIKVSATNGVAYTVTVSDKFCVGRIDSDTVSLLVPATPVPPTSGGDLPICSGDPIPTLSVVNLPNGVTAKWYDAPQGGNVVGQGELFTPAVSSSDPAVYTFYVESENVNGCVSTLPRTEITLTIYDSPEVDASYDVSTCEGDPVQIAAQGSGGDGQYTYDWDNNLGIGQTHTVSPTGLTTYNVTVTDGNGCQDDDAIIVAQLSNPVLFPIQADAEICRGDSATLTANANQGTGDLTFNWSWNNGQNSGQAITDYPLQTTTYEVIVSDENGCSDTKNVTVTVLDLPALNVIGETEICSGKSTSISVNVTNGNGNYNCFWPGISTECTQTFSPISDTNYTVEVTDTDTGCKDQQTFSITVNPLPVVSIDTTSSDCSAATGTATATGGFVSYIWSNNEQGQTISGLAANTYQVTVTDNKGCTSTAAAEVDNKAAPNVSLTSTDTVICQGTTVLISSQVNGGNPPYDYLWSDSSMNENLEITPSQSATYSLTVTDVAGCIKIKSRTIAVNEPASVDLASLPGQLCANGSSFLSPEISGNHTFLEWTANDGVVFSPNANVTNPTISLSDPSIQTVQLMLTATGILPCPQVTESFTINVNQPPDIVLIDSDCADDLNSYTAIFTTSPEVVVMPPSIGTLTGQAGNYQISGIPPNSDLQVELENTLTGCIGSATIAGIVCECALEAPIANSDSVFVCDNQVVNPLEVTVAANELVNWYDADTSLVAANTDGHYLPSEAGTYYAQTIDTLSNCESDQLTAITLSILETAAWGIEVLQDILCFGDLAIISIVADDGSLPSTVSWSNNQSSVTLANIMAGAYDVAVTDQNGCAFTDNILLIEPPKMDVTNIVPTDDNGQSNGSLEFQVNGGTPPYTISVTSSSSSASMDLANSGTIIFNNLAFGNYMINITDANGCESDEWMAVVDFSSGTQELLRDLNWTLYPNPSTGRVWVEISQTMGLPINCVVTDILGKTIIELEGPFTNQRQFELDLSGVAKGVYLVHLVVDGHIVGKKLILQ